MKRDELLKSKDYIVSQIQLKLLDLLDAYKKNNKLKDYQLAEKLNVSKGYVSQVLSATYDHKISKVVDLALACNAVPLIYFVDLDEFIENDRKDMDYALLSTNRMRYITFENIEGSAKVRSFNEKVSGNLLNQILNTKSFKEPIAIAEKDSFINFTESTQTK